MNNTIENIIKNYHDEHNISKSVNILDIAKMKKPDNTIKTLKCICHFLEPTEGWPRNVANTNSADSKCYYCSIALKDMFSDYMAKTDRIMSPNINNQQCQYCYWFCCKKYISDNGCLKLTNSFIKKRKKR